MTIFYERSGGGSGVNYINLCRNVCKANQGFAARVWKKELMTASTRAKASAHQKLSTWKPGTMASTSITSPPMMTKVNRPRVRMLMGNVRTARTGPSTALTAPRTTATMTAVTKLYTVPPGRILAATNTAALLVRMWMTIFMFSPLLTADECYSNVTG